MFDTQSRTAGFAVLTTRYGLPEGAAHVVVLACQGLECKEIADALGLSESTIKKKLSLAARRLKARGRGHLCALSGMVACGIDLERAQSLLREQVAEVAMEIAQRKRASSTPQLVSGHAAG
jgi:predicted transcriptional regulator